MTTATEVLADAICHKCKSEVKVRPNGHYVLHVGYPNGSPMWGEAHVQNSIVLFRA